MGPEHLGQRERILVDESVTGDRYRPDTSEEELTAILAALTGSPRG